MMSTTPHNTWRRKRAKIPATTKTTARIHKMSSMAAGYPAGGESNPRNGRCHTLAATRRRVSWYSSLECIAEAIRKCGNASAGRFCRSRVRPST